MPVHTHTCSRCTGPFECDGHYSRNYDGWPEAVCSWYHEADMTECGDCATTNWCGECGEWPCAAGSDVCARCYGA